MTVELKLPPNSPESEQWVIGGLLLDNSAWDRIADIITERDFYRDDHRRVFGHIRRLIESGRPADVLTVYDSIEKNNEVEQSGGMAFLGEVANAAASPANIRHHARIIKERAVRRALIEAAGRIDALACGGGDIAVALEEAQRLIGTFDDVGAEAEPKPMSEILGRAVDEISRRFEAGAAVSGLPTGFRDLDQKLGGLQPGDLIIIAGRPGMGKSAAAMNIAEHVGAVERQAVVVFSLEMPDVALATRSIAAQGAVPADRLRTGRLGDENWDGITASLARLHEAPIWIDSSSSLSVGQMHARCRRLARRQKTGLGLVVVDYLQLMQGDGSTRNEEISGITRRLKLMAKDLNCPVVALSQLSRKVEERTNRRPLMSDLRDSGSIEQDADVVLMMYRDEYYRPDTQDKGIAEVIIGKHRNGPTGTVCLAFQGEFCRFANLAEGYRRHTEPDSKISRKSGFR